VRLKAQIHVLWETFVFMLRPRQSFAALLATGALLGGCGDVEQRASGDGGVTGLTTARSIEDLATATATATATADTPPPQPAQTLADARDAVAGDDYARAVTIAVALGASKADAIRRIISNRIARRVQSTLSAGDRDEAGRLLRQSDRYPTTQLLRQARASYGAAN